MISQGRRGSKNKQVRDKLIYTAKGIGHSDSLFEKRLYDKDGYGD